MGCLAIVQAVGWNVNRLVAILQALTPYLGLLLPPVMLWSLWRRRFTLTTVACAVGFGLLVLTTPLVTGAAIPDVPEDAARIRVASVNLLYGNDHVAEVAADLRASAPDVIVLNEYTAEHQTTMQASALAADYPYRIDRSGLLAGGIALWSRQPVLVADHPDTSNSSIDVQLETPDGMVRVVAVHPPTPVSDFDAWRRDLDLIEDIGRNTDEPTAVVGDFNASYWHPAFRDLLDVGFTDAHIATGRGFSTSWPTNRPFPPFVQLDHALAIGGLAPMDLDDFDIAGSDHRGFVVTLALIP